MTLYVLENKKAVPVDLRTWSDWFETADRQVDFTKIEGYEISTVFLGIDYGHGFTREPLLFETMIFGNVNLDNYQTRCATWDEAIEMHKEAIELINAEEKDV
jgi:hypothetical protein